ncbi:MAG: segregation/condensation protein A, partial [Caulobacterales bacterium]|nr:segregation/condensation protein A [Caulobacterales bacterium]
GVAPGDETGQGPGAASYLASTLAASLELVKEGALEARQMEAFADVYLRRRETLREPEAVDA